MADTDLKPGGEEQGWFDRFAENGAHLTAKSYAFFFAVMLIILWAPSILIFKKIDTWQLIINTATTIITFMMVFLIQNQQWRDGQALNKKLNAIADGLADLMEAEGTAEMDQHVKELRDAVGLEQREST